MKALLIFFLNHKVGLRGTCFSCEGVSVLAELEFLYKVPAPFKAMVKGAPMEEDLCPNFVTVTQGSPRLVQEPPPPGLIPAPGLDDSEISEDDSDEEEEEERHSASVGGHFRQILKFFKTLF